MTARPDLQRLDPHAVARLPYHFAKRHGVLCVREADGAIEIWARSGVASLALAELQRALGRPLELHEFAPEAFDAALNRAYERGLNPAERIVGDLGDSEFNLEELAHSLPPTADLLEDEDDGPIVRLINALPAGHGERVVMRLLDKQAGRLSLPGLGMAKQTLETLDHIIHQPHGIILVTGPTGSGKTTTLYAPLGH